MDSCCQSSTDQSTIPTQCPVCHQKGKGIQLITLKAMLQPIALEIIHPECDYFFCINSSCEVIYFCELQTFERDMLKVSVYQKDDSMAVPVCYCFGWTRERIVQAVKENQQPIDRIREQVQANRCGCEVNNPQGSCCLGNVTTFIRSLDKS
ncbi:copper chaperone Copz family protein [Paenibacillus phoenicis]|uniref:Copper chaperone Copz family protein n=2 Tax=Paenibacillus TaxID=44249 RepID=A0ABW3SA23_9BACL|nr:MULTISPECIES: copper chaperone Copz family protein [Paenibacillaceae]MCH1638844.1 copper chaperone Copz family protein [Paenibacillus timonensis]MEA3570699.1 copper chaperone Copz family protein [Paenibacillus phoenicis]